MKNLLNKISNFLDKILKNEEDKWKSGLKNNYFRTSDLIEDLNEVLEKWKGKI